MKLACLLLSIVVASVSAFGVVTRQSRAVSSTPRRAFVPKPTVILFDKKDDEDEEDPLLDNVVEDDEWMRLTIELTDAVYGEVKRLVDRVVDDEDKEKIEKAGREIEVFVKAEVEKIRLDAKADLSKFNSDLYNKVETEVRNVTGDKDFKLEDYKKETEARIMTALTDFSVGKATMEGLKEEIAKRVKDRVEEAKDSAGYEFWKFKKALEKEQDKQLKKVLATKEGNFFSKLFGSFGA